MRKVVAVVPTRKGSQRVKSKNTRPFADTTLLDLKLEVLKKVEGLDEIIVNTDCSEAAQVAKRHNVSVQERTPYYASSEVSNTEHWHHLAQTTPGDIVVLAQATSPFVKAKTFSESIEFFIKNSELYNSLNSVSEEKKFLWKDNQPLNYKNDCVPKSQELPDIVSLNFAVTIIAREIMVQRRNVVGDRPLFIKTHPVEGVDIDDQMDFDFSEFLYLKLGPGYLFD